MKKRYLYALLFGVPGFFVAGLAGIFGFAALAGALWLYVFGDNPWPAYIEPLLAILFVLTVLFLWMIFIVLGFFIGRGLEKDPALNRTHILISAGLSLLCLLFLVFQQWSVGNLGPKSDSTLCGDFCSLHGYAASGMPPAVSGDRTCSCYDSSGHESLRIPLDHLEPDFAK
jgi:hypothetical protein